MTLETTPELLVALGLAAFLVGLAKAGLGGGLGPLITVLVTLVVRPSDAIGVILPLLMVGDVVALWALRGRWSRPAVAALLPAAVVGVVVASLFLGTASDRLIEVVLAVVSLAFVGYRLVQQRLPVARGEAGPLLAAVAGGTSGVASTIAHAGGPPIAIYLLAARLPPVPFVATTAAFFFVVNWLKVPGYVAAGVLDTSVLRFLPLAAFVVPGALVGRWLVRRIDPGWFERIVLTLLTIGAVRLLAG